MNTEIYIESFPVDISKDMPSLLNFAIDDVKDFSSRSTTWSKTIVLPGTSNNNKIFGHIFQPGQSNPHNTAAPNIGINFNASKSAACIIFQSGIQTFKGLLRLLQINVDKGRNEYEVAVFGELFGLNVALSSGKLEDLDFSVYDHTFNKDAIINSWDNPGGGGIYYPLADYGNYSKLKHDWEVGTFRPALYVKEYLDKIFAAAGFRYECALFQTDRFKKMIIPHNQKRLTRRGTDVGFGGITSPASFHIEIDPESSGYPVFFALYVTVWSSTNFIPVNGNQIIQYNGASPVIVNITVPLKGFQDMQYLSDEARFSLYHYDDATAVTTRLDSRMIATGAYATFDFVLSATGVQVATNDLLYVSFETVGLVYSPYTGDFTVTEYNWTIVSNNLQLLNVNYDDPVKINDTIPKNIRQVDFLLGIIKMFNLFLYEDRFDTRLIRISPYIDFYSTNSANSVDWSYKLNRDKVFKIKPMSELNAKKYEFKFKSDNDYYNDLYRKRYGEGYGDYVFDSVFEFATQTKTAEVVFSATPLIGYDSEDKIYSTIFKRTGSDTEPVEENVDSNIRIMLSKKITGVTPWKMFNGVTELESLTNYGYAGHFDDPDAPSNDLNFGALKELFFILVSGALNVTQFNVYWSPFMAELTDKDGKLFTGNFYLTPKDILELDFSKFVYLDGVLYRLNKISDYNVSNPADCSVQLLKVNYLIY